MDAVLHGVEALPGDGRYAVRFRFAGGAEQTAVLQLLGDGADGTDGTNGDVQVADASLPSAWARAGDGFAALCSLVRALQNARAVAGGSGPVLRDVEGGWDVGLGNVVVGPADEPECTAHGAMTEQHDVWSCPECGAQAIYHGR